jgi:hypothetical protein
MKPETLLELVERLDKQAKAWNWFSILSRSEWPRLRDALREMRVALVMEGHHDLLARLDNPENEP